MYIHIQLSGERGFLTTKGSPVSNAPLIAKLLEAISQPTQVAILHYKGHETTHNTVSLGNNKADQVAGQIALQQGPLPILFLRTSLTLNYSKAKIEALLSQENTSKHSSGWITLHDKLVLPEKQAMSIITQIHDSLHIGPRTLLTFPSPLFSPLHLRPTIQAVHHHCLICAKTSPQGGLRLPQETHQLRGHLPGQDWQIDFTHMPRHRTFWYMLVCVDTF